jgi:acetyl esterase
MSPELQRASRLQPKYDYSQPALVRQQMRRNIAVAEAAGFWPRNDASVRWRDVPVPNTSVCARLYQPLGCEPGPAILFIHGGGFIVGDLDTEHPRCLDMCRETRATVLSVDYRLAPEHPYPSGMVDCAAALSWLMEGSALEVDSSRVAVVGCSAGGCLASALSLMRRDQGQRLPCLQVLIYPVLDDTRTTASMRQSIDTPVWDFASANQSWRYYLGERLDTGPIPAYAAPARASSLAGLPPTYLLVADLDPLRDEGLAFGVRLIESRVPTELHHFPEAFHGFDTLSSAEPSVRARRTQYAVLSEALAARR